MLARLVQPVPETWQQLLGLAALLNGMDLNGTDLNGDGVLDHALRVDVDPGQAGQAGRKRARNVRGRMGCWVGE